MDTLMALPWRLYPAAVFMIAGTTLVGYGIWRDATALALPVSNPAKGTALVRAFRIAILGLCVASIGLAWLWQIGWLIVLAACVAGEELLETSVVMAAIRTGEPAWQQATVPVVAREPRQCHAGGHAHAA
jgi:hypothetical protein